MTDYESPNATKTDKEIVESIEQWNHIHIMERVYEVMKGHYHSTSLSSHANGYWLQFLDKDYNDLVHLDYDKDVSTLSVVVGKGNEDDFEKVNSTIVEYALLGICQLEPNLIYKEIMTDY